MMYSALPGTRTDRARGAWISRLAAIAALLILGQVGQVMAQGKAADLLTRLDLPIAGYDDAASRLEGTITAHDDTYHLTHLDFAGGRFTVIRKPLPVGSAVRLRVAARDVSLTLEHQSGTSILNIFPATIDGLIPEGEAQVTVRLMVAGVPMLARVTRKSAAVLDLKPGKAVYAQAKSVALLS